tara:strand:+ start:811 stop:1335 length:525 start_codon:yes stop_codon:yes gene_type:complete
MLVDASLTAITGLSSLLYHTNRLLIHFDNDVALRNTDIVMANYLVFHTGNMILYSSDPRRFQVGLLLIPFIVYTAETSIVVRLIIMGSYGIVCFAYGLKYLKRYRKKYIFSGIFLIICEMIFFNFANHWSLYYEWFHGIHHILAFLAQSSFIYAIYKDGLTDTQNCQIEGSCSC